MRAEIRPEALDWLLYFLLTFSVLWKGGKALDATWMLAGLSCAITLGRALFIPRTQKSSLPLLPWNLSFLFLAWSFLSFLFSETRNVGFDELLQTASLFLLFSYALSISSDRLQHVVSRFARILSIALLVACAIGFLVYVFQPVPRFVGTFFDYRFTTDYWPNAWAQFLLLAWPMLVWSIWCRESSRGSTGLRVAVSAIPLSCLFLSYSRGGVLAAVGQAVILGVIGMLFFRSTWSMRTILKRSIAAFSLAIVIFAAANVVRSQNHETESVMRKATFTAGEGKSSVSERSQFWKQALVLTNQKPLFGFGLYSFRFIQPHLQGDVLATSDHPHNVFLKFAVEKGVPASILFFLLLVLCLYSGIRGVLQRSTEIDPTLAAFVITSVIGVTLHNLIDYNLQFVGIAAPFWVMLGALAKRGNATSTTTPRMASAMTVLIAAILLFFALQEVRFLYEGSIARKLERAGESAAALEQYQKTDRSLFQRDNLLSRASLLLQRGQLKEAQKMIDREIMLNPQDYRVWKLQGNIALAAGNRAEALSAFNRAYEGGRYNDLGITRVLIELLMKDPKEFSERRHEFELLLNDYALAMLQNTHFIDLSQNVEELVKVCTLLAVAYPEERSLYLDLSTRVLAHAGEERSKQRGRQSGLLWE